MDKLMNEKQQRNAILGFIGVVLFMLGDCLLYIYPGRNMQLDIDAVSFS